MRYRFIQAEKASYPVEVLCRVLTDLRAHGLRVGRHRVARLMRLHGLRSVRRWRTWHQPGKRTPCGGEGDRLATRIYRHAAQ